MGWGLDMYVQNTLAGKSGSIFPSPGCESGVCWVLLCFFSSPATKPSLVNRFSLFPPRQSFTLPPVTAAFLSGRSFFQAFVLQSSVPER